MASDAHTGEIGASIAFHLAERGARSVTVLDARRAGEGISSTSSALVRMHYTFEPEVHTWPCEAWSTSVTGRTAQAGHLPLPVAASCGSSAPARTSLRPAGTP